MASTAYYYFATVEQVARLPRVTWETRHNLPDRPGIYFVVIGNGVDYIGRSGISLKGRWRQHPLRRVFESVGPFGYPTYLVESSGVV